MANRKKHKKNRTPAKKAPSIDGGAASALVQMLGKAAQSYSGQKQQPQQQSAPMVSGDRVNAVIQRMSKPETLLDHLNRIGAPYYSAPTGVDSSGEFIARACLVIPWDTLVRSELEHIRSGGEFQEAYPVKQDVTNVVAAQIREAKEDTDFVPNVSDIGPVNDQYFDSKQMVDGYEFETTSHMDPDEGSEEAWLRGIQG